MPLPFFIVPDFRPDGKTWKGSGPGIAAPANETVFDESFPEFKPLDESPKNITEVPE